MGQVHPTGPNVITLIQTGGDCRTDCGKPRFRTADPIDQRFFGLVSQQQFTNKIEETNIILKKHTPSLWFIISGFIFLAIAPHLLPPVIYSFGPPTDKVKSGDNKVDSHGQQNINNTVQCGRGNNVQYETACKHCQGAHEDKKYCNGKDCYWNDDDSDCVSRNQHYEDEEHYESQGEEYYEEEHEDHEEDKEEENPLGGLFFMLPFISIVVFLGWILNAQKVVSRKIKALFLDWERTKGITVIYSAAKKHSQGRLTFILPANMAYNNNNNNNNNQQQQQQQQVVVTSVMVMNQPQQPVQLGQLVQPVEPVMPLMPVQPLRMPSVVPVPVPVEVPVEVPVAVVVAVAETEHI